jgi:hypothetical protein
MVPAADVRCRTPVISRLLRNPVSPWATLKLRIPLPRRGATVPELPFRTLLYRYFFFSWLFKDVNASGDLFERAAAMRHNRRMAGWLPKYMLRWLWWGLFFYGLAGVAELIFEAAGGARLLYAASAICLSFSVPVVIAWVHLTQRPERSQD